MRSAGLASDVEQMYNRLFDRSDHNVVRLAGELDWSEVRVRMVMDALAHMCTVPFDGADVGHGPATDSRTELSTLLVDSEAALDWRRRQIETSLAAASALAAEYGRARRAPEVVDWLDGLAAVRARLTESAERAELERQSRLSGNGRTTQAEDGPVAQEVAQRGGRIRSIYQNNFRGDPSTLEYVRWLTELGGENRTVPTLPVMMIIVDRRTALIPLDPTDVQRGVLELRSPEAVKAMHALFDKLWAIATPWHESRMSDDPRLTLVQRVVIELLGAGHTDEVISRRIGVSLRTVRRITADLMTRLMARSRFEAGVRAAKLGWL
jgi:DNA-binding CsgD family transcriptional regulator